MQTSRRDSRLLSFQLAPGGQSVNLGCSVLLTLSPVLGRCPDCVISTRKETASRRSAGQSEARCWLWELRPATCRSGTLCQRRNCVTSADTVAELVRPSLLPLYLFLSISVPLAFSLPLSPHLLLLFHSLLLALLSPPSPHLPTPNVHEIESENCFCMGIMLNHILLYTTYSRGKLDCCTTYIVMVSLFKPIQVPLRGTMTSLRLVAVTTAFCSGTTDRPRGQLVN